MKSGVVEFRRNLLTLLLLAMLMNCDVHASLVFFLQFRLIRNHVAFKFFSCLMNIACLSRGTCVVCPLILVLFLFPALPED